MPEHEDEVDDQNGVVDPAELDLGHGRSSGEWAANGSGRRVPAYVRQLGPATQGPLASGHQPPYLDPGPLGTGPPSHRSQESRMRRFSACTALGLAALALTVSPLAAQVRVASPDGRNQVTVEIREGRLTYSLTRDGRPLILPSRLGFEFRGRAAAARRAPDHRHHAAVARRVVDAALGRGGPGARPPQRAGGGGGGDRGVRPAVHPARARLRRRHRLPLRAARAAGAGRLRDQRRADRVRSGRQRARLVDSLQLAPDGPLGDALLVRAGERARQRADAAHHGDSRTAARSW